MKKVFFNFQDPINSYPLNERQVGFMKAGRYKGYNIAVKESSGVYKVSHNSALNSFENGSERVETDLDILTRTNINLQGKVTSDKSIVQNFGVCMMPTGVIIHEPDDIRVNINQNNLTSIRYDLLVVSHEYLNIQGGQIPTYEIIMGTEVGTLPTLPSKDKKVALGIFEIPAGQIDNVNVLYKPFVAPMLGDLMLDNILDLAASRVILPEGDTTKKGIIKLSNIQEGGTTDNTSTAMTPASFYNNKATTNKVGIVKLSSTQDYSKKPVTSELNNTVTIGGLHDNLAIMNNNVQKLTESNYTLKDTDNGKIFIGSLSSGSSVNVTVPSGLPTAFHVGFMFGTSNVTIVAQGTNIIKKVNSQLKMVEIGSAMLLNSTSTQNEFILTGDLFDTRYN